MNTKTVKHSVGGKAIGVVKQPMSTGCFQWNVSDFIGINFLCFFVNTGVFLIKIGS